MIQQANIPEKRSFPPVPYARFAVQKLNPEQIDELLSNGYFRSDLHIYSSFGKYVTTDWRPCLMLRIPLQHFHWKKRSKKLLRRNAKVFDVRIQPFLPRPEIQEIWHLFKKKVHGWTNVPDLAKHLFRGHPPANFHTHEVGVYFETNWWPSAYLIKGMKVWLH